MTESEHRGGCDPTTRRAARAVKSLLVACLLGLSACGNPEPGTLKVVEVPDAAQLREVEQQATEVGESFFHMLARNDVRLCDLLERRVRDYLTGLAKASSCPTAVTSLYASYGSAQRARIAAVALLRVEATSLYRVEIYRPDRDRSSPMVVERLIGTSTWKITALG